MKKYKTLATVRLFSGSVILNAEQAARRSDCLAEKKKGVFEVLKPVEFKAGEIIGFDAIPKPYKPLLEEIKTASQTKTHDHQRPTDD